MLPCTTTQIRDLKPGSIILIKIPQADGFIKQRPAIVLKQMPGYGDFLVCGISSQLRQAIPKFDEVLISNQINGLKVTSVIRLGFLAVVPAKQVIKIIGQVPDTLYNTLLQRLADYLRYEESDTNLLAQKSLAINGQLPRLKPTSRKKANQD